MHVRNLAVISLVSLIFLTSVSVVYATSAADPNQVEALIQKNSLTEALAVCNAGLASDPNNIDLLHKRIVIYRLMDQPGKANADFDKLISLTKNAAEKKSLLAYKSSYYGKNTDAKNYIDQAIKLDPTNPHYYATRAEIVIDIDMANSRAALADIDKALSIDPKFYGAYYARARIYQKMGDKQKAAQDFATAEKLKKEAKSTAP